MQIIMAIRWIRMVSLIFETYDMVTLYDLSSLRIELIS